MKFVRIGAKMTVIGNFAAVTSKGILLLKGCTGVVVKNRLEDNQVLVGLLIGNTEYEIPLSLLKPNLFAVNKNG